MVSEKLEQVKRIAQFNTQSYLVAISNMGIFKRAQKEFAAAQISINVQSDGVAVIVNSVNVFIKYESNGFKCSCASPVVCVHIIMAIMAVDNYAKSIVGNTQKTQPTNFDDCAAYEYLEKLTIEFIKGMFPTKTYQSAINKFSDSEINVSGGAQKVIVVNGQSVVFLPNASISSAVCSCKQSKCVHLCLALLHLATANDSVIKENDFTFDENALRLMNECLQFLTNVFYRGAFGVNKSDAEVVMFYSLNLSMFSEPLGKYLKSLATILQSFSENQVYSNEDKLMFYFCRVVNILNIAIKNNGNAEILSRVMESPKNIYFLESYDDFISLGIYPFIAASGYIGATHLLFSIGQKKLYSCADVLPTIYSDYSEQELESKIQELLKSENIFSGAVGKKFRLNNFKKSKNGNITSTNQSIAGQLEPLTQSDFRSIPFYTNIYPKSNVKKIVDYFSRDAQKSYLLLPFSCLNASNFDNAEGELVIDLQYNGERLSVYLEYNSATRYALNNLEKNEFNNGCALLQSFEYGYRLISVFLKNDIFDIYKRECE